MYFVIDFNSLMYKLIYAFHEYLRISFPAWAIVHVK